MSKMNSEAFLRLGRRLHNDHSLNLSNNTTKHKLNQLSVEDVNYLLNQYDFNNLTKEFLRNNINGDELCQSYESNNIIEYFNNKYEISISNLLNNNDKLLLFLSLIKDYAENDVSFNNNYIPKLYEDSQLVEATIASNINTQSVVAYPDISNYQIEEDSEYNNHNYSHNNNDNKKRKFSLYDGLFVILFALSMYINHIYVYTGYSTTLSNHPIKNTELYKYICLQVDGIDELKCRENVIILYDKGISTKKRLVTAITSQDMKSKSLLNLFNQYDKIDILDKLISDNLISSHYCVSNENEVCPISTFKIKSNDGILIQFNESLYNDDIIAIETFLKATDINVNSTIDNSTGSLPIHIAARCNSINAIKLLLDNNADIDAITNDGDTPLLLSTYFGHIDTASYLISREANVSVKDKYNQTLLFACVDGELLDICKYAINHGIDVLTRNSDGFSAVYNAVETGNQTIVEYLLDNGAIREISRLNDGFGLLHIAANNNHSDIVKLLIERGSDLLAVTEDNYTALHIAASNGYLSICKIILDIKPFDPNQYTNFNGESPVHLAVDQGHLDVLKYLASAQFNLTAETVDGVKPIYLCNQIDVCDYLINQKYSTIHPTDFNEILVNTITDNNFELSEYLIKRFSLMNLNKVLQYSIYLNNYNMTELVLKYRNRFNSDLDDIAQSLHMAVELNNLEIVKLLVSNGFDIYNTDFEGKLPIEIAIDIESYDVTMYLAEFKYPSANPLFYAVYNENCNVLIVEGLINKGFSIHEYDKYRCTLLHYAVLSQNIDIVRLLIENGINKNAQDKDSMTALYYAVYYEFYEITKYLLLVGCNPNLRSNNGIPLIDLARSKSNIEIIKLLKDFRLY